jgi:adhesin/invasin
MKTTHLLTAALLGLAATAGCAGDEPCVPGPGEICTYAGNGDNAYLGDDGPATEASMSLPMDAKIGPDGTLYILDWNNHRIRRVTEDGMMVHVAGRGELGGTLDDPARSDFNHPTGLLFSDDGNTLYIAAWHNSMIRSYDLTSDTISDNCGDGRRAYFGDGGPAADATLDLPTSIVWDPDGNLVIMDQANQVIRRVDDSGVIETIAGTCVTVRAGGCEGLPLFECPGGSGKMSCDPDACGNPCEVGYGGDGGPAAELRMAQPFGQSALPGGRLLYDPDGNLLFADSSNNLIRKIDTDGVVTRIAGKPPVDGLPQRGYSGDGGPATDALLANPVDLAMADDGTLYFTDVDNHCVRAIDPDGTIRSVVGVCGEAGYAGDGGSIDEALLKYPFGLELDGDTLYIADMGNSVIRKAVLPE